MRFRLCLAAAIALIATSWASAQVGIGIANDSIGYPIVRPFPYYPYGYFGYFPGEFGTQWSNGFNRYGPPVPTYGPTPGQFGGSDQRLNYTRLSDPRPFNRPPITEENMIRPTFAEITLMLPSPEARVSVNGVTLKQSGSTQSFRATRLPQGMMSRLTVEVQWTAAGQERQIRREIAVRGGQSLRVDLATARGSDNPANASTTKQPVEPPRK